VTQGQARSSAAQPHIVMIVSNDVRTDSRVRKSAVSAARSGAKVTLLGLALDGVRDDVDLVGVHLIRLPAPLAFSKGVAARRKRQRRVRRLTGYASTDELRLARLRADLTQIDATHAAATGHRLKGQLLAALAGQRRFVTRGRPAAQRRADLAQRFAWRGYDGIVNRIAVGARWRRLLPEVQDYEDTFGPALDELGPDLIHAHDVQILGVAARAKARAGAEGRHLSVLYDAHEYVAGLSQYGGRTKRKVAAWSQLEREFVHQTDHVVTVSPQLARELHRRYHLKATPTVVLNTPLEQARSSTARSDVRAVAGLAADVPLLVYSGGVQQARGVQFAIESLRHLPGVHLAIVAVPHPDTAACRQMKQGAESLGVDDRVHWLDPVAPDDLVAFLSTADIGVIPLRHYPSHEMALTNKQFEYLHAGLPLVVSDCVAQAEFVRQHGVGLVHRADDAADLARAVGEVLDDRQKYVGAATAPGLREQFSWEQSEQVLHRVYRQLLGDALEGPESLSAYPALVERPFRVDRGGRQLLSIGPTNMAGQGWAWGRAVERVYPEVDVEVFTLQRETLNFPADVTVDPKDFAHSARWQLRWAQHLRTEATHVLMEAGRPVMGRLNGSTFAADVDPLRQAGIAVGLVFHGSEIRDPRRHAELYPWSPFRDPKDELTARLQRQLEELAPLVAAFDGPKFVSTPDLLDDVPGATWLPVVVDLDLWTPGDEPLQRDRPLVVHAPSNRALKGTQLIEPVLAGLVDRGLVEYRRIEGVPPKDVPALMRSADIVLDHFGIGNYGVVTCEAMASGRISISHIHERVRARVPQPIPTLEATPDTLAAVIEKVLDDRDAARATAAEGPGFVRRWHDGRRSAAALAAFLGRDTPDLG
jgi:glycosyltransferase involved in cell wall biosynthesis